MKNNHPPRPSRANHKVSDMKKMITVRVTADQHKQIKMLSAETGLSIKEIFWIGVEQARTTTNKRENRNEQT